MPIIHKTLTLFLLLPVFLLNLSDGLVASCRSKLAMQKIPCCSQITPEFDTSFSKPPCCCKFSKSSKPIPQTIDHAELFNLNIKQLKRYAAEILSSLDFDGNPKQPQQFVFKLFHQPKFLSDSKIYTFISSYLI